MQAVDNAGNTTEANNEIKTITVACQKHKDHVTVEHSTKEPTNKPVTVTFEKDETVKICIQNTKKVEQMENG